MSQEIPSANKTPVPSDEDDDDNNRPLAPPPSLAPGPSRITAMQAATPMPSPRSKKTIMKAQVVIPTKTKHPPPRKKLALKLHVTKDAGTSKSMKTPVKNSRTLALSKRDKGKGKEQDNGKGGESKGNNESSRMIEPNVDVNSQTLNEIFARCSPAIRKQLDTITRLSTHLSEATQLTSNIQSDLSYEIQQLQQQHLADPAHVFHQLKADPNLKLTPGTIAQVCQLAGWNTSYKEQVEALLAKPPC
ncbi:hypothetical protein K435DRAFT_861781 [Dendrothele bispora CBS 962.96]|uniref:Uncharacterized protein n=1 Tax=Dendrothele bispora (strain CBS 962.96) TaxID=1314807 RepID=A0A4S8LUA0_DENBC|nr:hypothetical protein K435DRAFT_861781 [Dendrothele bispora CBS 962.96]